MNAPILVLRVGYMEHYEGPDTITGGGAYIAEKGVGGEVFNFKPSGGKVYGYAMSRHFAGVNLGFLDVSQPWQRGDELSGVDVVFIARRPGVGQVVVGWYRNATVFHQQYRVRRGSIPGMKSPNRRFLCTADARPESICLLPEDKRTFVVPAAPAGFRGFPGESNVWYPSRHIDKPAVASFIRKLRRYIGAATGDAVASDEAPAIKGGGGRGRAGSPDPVHNAMVEEAAVKAVRGLYKTAGFEVKSVESECRGWDLEASKGRKSLLIEVKGTAGATIYFELTPNEYAKLKEHSSIYRVCVVCEALTNPRIFDLRPEVSANGWRLVSDRRDVTVPLMERVAAVGAEVASDE